MLPPIKIKLINKDKNFHSIGISPLRIKIFDLDFSYSFIKTKVFAFNSFVKPFEVIGGVITGAVTKLLVSSNKPAKGKIAFDASASAQMASIGKTKTAIAFDARSKGLVAYSNKVHNKVGVKHDIYAVVHNFATTKIGFGFYSVASSVVLRVKKIVDLTGVNQDKLIGSEFNNISTIYDLCYYIE